MLNAALACHANCACSGDAARRDPRNDLPQLTFTVTARRHATLTLAELEAIDESTRTFEQVGKMFLLKPLPEVKQQLSESAETGSRDAAALAEKKKHVEETYKKIQEDFQEFVKAHMITAEEAEAKAKEAGRD